VPRLVDVERLAARAAPGGRLSNGLVVDASILARLLGLRLLRLDAHITLVPAALAIRSSTSPTASSRPPLPPSLATSPPRGGDLDDAVHLLASAKRELDQVSQDLNLGLRALRG
jgi:hypothetical protein